MAGKKEKVVVEVAEEASGVPDPLMRSDRIGPHVPEAENLNWVKNLTEVELEQWRLPAMRTAASVGLLKKVL